MSRRATPHEFRVGTTIRTPFAPAGLMTVERVDETFVEGRYVGDHPNGYASGSPARYLVADWAAGGVRTVTPAVAGAARGGEA